MEILRKEDLKGLLDGFIFNELSQVKYEVAEVDPKQLLTWNRFDLGFKLAYLDLYERCPELANEIYFNDIKAQTLGKFVEYGNEKNKNNFEHYIHSFEKTYSDVKENGFLKEKALIPLSTDGTIVNGAHRVASAIHLNQCVSAIVTEQDTMVADYKYFFERDVSVRILDSVAQKFIQYLDGNVHIAFLWPSGCGHEVEAENLFTKVVYKKKITLTPKGAFNLLYELYKHMDWVGSKDDGYKGIQQKLIECFPNFNSFQVIAFQSENLEKVQVVKQKVRDIYKIGYSSIHITDTKDEADRISQLLFNENGLHFINFSEPVKYDYLYESLDEFKQFLSDNKINPLDVLIDGSLTLALYGLRNNMDVDFLISDNSKLGSCIAPYETHDSELKYHAKKKSDLIYDDANFFVFHGLKFVSFSQLYAMKLNRNGEKDKNDCLIMKSTLEGYLLGEWVAKTKQKIFYMKIKLKNFLLTSGLKFLKRIGLYAFVRIIYRKLKV